MAKLMRCTTPHWQGNTFIDAGVVRPEGHPEVIPVFFESFTVDESAAESQPEQRRAARVRKITENGDA